MTSSAEITSMAWGVDCVAGVAVTVEQVKYYLPVMVRGVPARSGR